MVKIADARAASTISSPTLSLPSFSLLVIPQNSGPGARLFSSLSFHCTATLSDFSHLIFIFLFSRFPLRTGSETQKAGGADVRLRSLQVALSVNSFVSLLYVLWNRRWAETGPAGMYISVGSDILGGTFLGMVWVWKGTGQDGVGERGHHLMEKNENRYRGRC